MRALLLTLALAGLAPLAHAQGTAAQTVAAAPSLAGAWTYAIDTPNGTVEGVLRFEQDGGAWRGTIASSEAPDRSMPVRDLSVSGEGQAAFWIEAPNVGRVDFAVRLVEASRLTGAMTAMGMNFDLNGQRLAASTAPASPAAGSWSYALETPNGASTGRIELAQDAAGTLGGRIVRASGEVSELSSATLDGDVLTLVYPSARYGSMTMRLTLSGDALSGALLVGQTEMPVRATRLVP